MSSARRLRESPDVAARHSNSPVEEWFRLSTRQRAQSFPSVPGDPSGVPGHYSHPIPVEGGNEEECAGQVSTPVQQERPDAEQVRHGLQSLIKSFRKTGPSSTTSDPRPAIPEDLVVLSPNDVPLASTRKELQVLINSYRETGDMSDGNSTGNTTSGDGTVARGLNFDDLMEDSMLASANPAESILEPPATVRKSDALSGLADMFADVSAVAEKRLQRGSPTRPREIASIPIVPQPSFVFPGDIQHEAASGELVANIEIASVLFKELGELQEQLQFAREEMMDSDSTKSAPIASSSREENAQSHSAADIQADNQIFPLTPNHDESFEVDPTLLENLTDRLDMVLRVLHNVISLTLSSTSQTVESGGDVNGLQQQDLRPYLSSLLNSLKTGDFTRGASERTCPSSPGSRNPDDFGVIAPMIKKEHKSNSSTVKQFHFLGCFPSDSINFCARCGLPR